MNVNGVEFEEDSSGVPTRSFVRRSVEKTYSFITGLVIKSGLASTEQTAKRVLIIIAMLIFLAAILVAISSTIQKSAPYVSPAVIEQMERRFK